MPSRRRRLRFALTAVAGSATLALALGFAADLYAHKKYEKTALVNVWGYRGPVAGGKQPGEIRIAVVGGSTAFGYGTDWDGAMPYLLERRLNALNSGRFSVLNLGYNNDGAYAMRFTLEDFAWLDYDTVILYEGYNDLGDTPNFHTFRRRSGVFRLTGYLPILPLVLNEKASVLLYGGAANLYEGNRTRFSPGLVRQTTAKALDAAAATARSLEDQVGKLTKNTAAAMSVTPAAECPARWQHYCGAMFDAITYARARGKRVLVGTQPFVSDRHVEQQQALVAFLESRLGNDPQVQHVNLGEAIDLAHRRDIAYDGLHLTAEGNDIIARHLTQPVFELSTRRQTQ